MPRPKRDTPPTPPRKYYVVVSAVEMLVDETSLRGLIPVVEERAKQLGVPITDITGSGLIRIFAGEEIEFKVDAPTVRVEDESLRE